MKAEVTYDMSVNIYHITRCHIRDDRHLHSHRLRTSNAFVMLIIDAKQVSRLTERSMNV